MPVQTAASSTWVFGIVLDIERLHSIVFDETYACCCQCGWTESARGKTTVAEVGHSKVIHLTIWRRSKTIRIISDSFRPRFLISSFCSRVIMRVCLPRPISQQWQDSHLENIWVSFQSMCVRLQWNRASPRRKDDGGVGLLNYEDRPGLETGGFGWSPMSSRLLSWPQDLSDNNDDQLITRIIYINLEIIPDKMSCLGTDHHYPAPRTQVAKIMRILRKQPHLLRVSVFTLSDPWASSWPLRIPCIFKF